MNPKESPLAIGSCAPFTFSHGKLCPVHRGTIAMSGRVAPGATGFDFEMGDEPWRVVKNAPASE
jgi:hypothetical protein